MKIDLSKVILSPNGKPAKFRDGKDSIEIMFEGKRGIFVEEGHERELILRDVLIDILSREASTNDKRSITIMELCFQINDETVTEVELAKKRSDLLCELVKDPPKDQRTGKSILTSVIHGQLLKIFGYESED